MDSQKLLTNLEEYYSKTESFISDEGISIKMTYAPWGCTLLFSKECSLFPENIISKLNESGDLFCYSYSNGILTAKVGLINDKSHTKSSLKLLLDSGIARFNAAELLLKAGLNARE